MSNNRFITTLLVASLATIASSCDDGDPDGDLDETQISVGADQEAAMCDDLGTNSSTQPAPKTAGAEIGSGGAIDAQPGRKEILFTDYGGQLGGFIRLSINPENETPVFVLLDTPVGFAAVDSSGAEVEYLESGESSAVCDAAAGRYLWVVTGSENHLRFGPTSAESVLLTIETVD